MHRREFLKRTALGAGSLAGLIALGPWKAAASVLGHLEDGAVRRSAICMGTRLNLTALCDDEARGERAIRLSLDAMGRVDRLMSVHREDSDLGRVNEGAGSRVSVDAWTAEVARASLDFASLTDGALDPTVLPLMRYWGFMGARGQHADVGELGSHLDRVGHRHLKVTERTVELDTGTAIDFGGIAKGYAVDQAVRQMRQQEIADSLIEAGGDLFASGRSPRGTPWRIGIRDPENPKRIVATVEMADGAAATSGGYEKHHVVGGRRVSHLLDPRTGEQALGVISATIFAPTTMEADALATATYVLGAKAGMDLVSDRSGVEGVWMTSDGRRWVSDGIADRIRWT